MSRHGSCCSNCSSVLALNVEVGNQGLSLFAKDLLKVYSSLLTSENLQEQRQAVKLPEQSWHCHANTDQVSPADSLGQFFPSSFFRFSFCPHATSV